MELNNWWSMDECIDRKSVTSILRKLKKEGKINYTLSGDDLEIEDLDLDLDDIDLILDVFEENDVFPNTDRLDEDDYDDYDDFTDEDLDDY
jgi:hypothetical protein